MNNDNQTIPLAQDAPAKPGRRSFVGNAMRVPVALMVPSLPLAAQAATTAASYAPALRARMLQRMAYLLFPLDAVSTGPYERSAAALLDAVEADPQKLALIDNGLAMLDAAAEGSWVERPEDAQVEAMSSIEETPFFQFMYGSVRVSIFDDREVWESLGYGGNALARGGYLDNLVEGIDWIHAEG